MPNPLPEFERPPVTEMVMGVQFQPIAGLQAAHLGLYWSRIRSDYPHTLDQAPLVPAVEEAEIKPAAPTISAIALSVPPLPRCWFMSENKTEVIQVQRDRFWRNWRQVEGNDRYPRYARLAPAFKRDWEGFLGFLREQGLGPGTVNQCELSYINNIEKGAGWSELGELDKVFPLLCPREPGGFLPSPEMLSWQARYKLPEGRGRLHVEMNPAFSGRAMKLVLAFNLTARGAPAGGGPEQIAAWFDLAHEWITRAFAELTGPAAHAFWEMKS
jgi:uncharacterized protein (TIGR04255 family)